MREGQDTEEDAHLPTSRGGGGRTGGAVGSEVDRERGLGQEVGERELDADGSEHSSGVQMGGYKL